MRDYVIVLDDKGLMVLTARTLVVEDGLVYFVGEERSDVIALVPLSRIETISPAQP